MPLILKLYVPFDTLTLLPLNTPIVGTLVNWSKLINGELPQIDKLEGIVKEGLGCANKEISSRKHVTLLLGLSNPKACVAIGLMPIINAP